MDEDHGQRLPPPAAHIEERIRARGAISYAEFMRMALYHPDGGYYRRERDRIGARPETDFYTAYSAGAVFAQLVTAAAVDRLGHAEAAAHTWVELGVDRQGSLWAGTPEPFAGLLSLGYGEPADIPGKAVVFSNELFDAQPFHRVRFNRGAWREAGVTLAGGPGGFGETLLPEMTPPVASRSGCLPAEAPEGTTIDLPIGAADLLENLASQNWSGLFLAFDYGKTWEQLVHECPEGTLRAYSRHRQVASILDAPGEQDLTGHICWDWMREILGRHGFTSLELLSQEAFFVRHATRAIEQIISRRPGLPDPDRQRLHQLIHPSNMGRKFQVLAARR